MMLNVKYFGQLRQMTGAENEECHLPDGATLAEAIADRGEAYGDGFRAIVLDRAGAVRPSLMVVVNGAAVDRADPPALRDGDEVFLLPAIAGG